MIKYSVGFRMCTVCEDFCENWSLIGCNVGTVQDCEHWSMIHLFRIAAPFSVYRSQNKNIFEDE